MLGIVDHQDPARNLRAKVHLADNDPDAEPTAPSRLKRSRSEAQGAGGDTVPEVGGEDGRPIAGGGGRNDDRGGGGGSGGGQGSAVADFI